MQHRLMTEYEWRKQAARPPKARPDWWGAQCLYPMGKERLKQDRSFHMFLLLISAVFAFILPVLIPGSMNEDFADGVASDSGQSVQVRKVSAVSYALPASMEYRQETFTRDQLLRGKMLLLDEAHPLPDDAPPPNTASIAMYGKGMVPVRSLSLKTGRETIDALQTLFGQLKQKGVEGLYVWQGTTTKAEQRARMIEQIRASMQTQAPDEAVRSARQQMDQPGTGVLLQEYAVELRLLGGFQQPDERLLEATQHGQKLLQLCWRYGFVRAAEDTPYRFRYVGKAHATAMTYLNLNFADYLEWLHQKGVLVVSSGGQPQYLILCKPMSGSHIAFDLPVGASYEASLDNTGYALVACAL